MTLPLVEPQSDTGNKRPIQSGRLSAAGAKTLRTWTPEADVLSEFEKRELDRIGAELEHDDPRLSSLLDGDSLRAGQGRIHRGLSMLIVGLGLMLAGQAMQTSILGVSGFALLCVGSYWTVRDLAKLLGGSN